MVEQGKALRARMRGVVEYLFSGDAELGPEVARLREGRGHEDLAADLLGYARMYSLRASVVSAHAKFDAGDEAAANQLCAAMLAELDAARTPEARTAADDLARSFAVLVRGYDEVIAACLWLDRGDPTARTRFPSLYSVGRRPRRSKKQPTPAPAPAPAPEPESPTARVA